MALENAEVDAPRADGFAVLVSQDAGELMEVGEVVRCPSGEELAEGDGAEGGMAAEAAEVGGLKIHGAESGEAFRADGSEFIKKLREGFALGFFVLAFAIERLEGLRLAVLEDHGGAGNPVGMLGVDEVADDVKGGPGGGAFVGMSEGFGEVAEEGIEGGGRAGEKSDGLREVWTHGAPSFISLRG